MQGITNLKLNYIVIEIKFIKEIISNMNPTLLFVFFAIIVTLGYEYIQIDLDM